ncbi:putative Ornithine decarboxylase [Cardiosporidium cionae]|uniref:ornithine decarboxylase n=1 Tax=Cardiosporidium cionae TaxID=476202 RepID=A0ABQ7JEA1_9APIC|nr:putative Ornithine decarboxylase [Cardiosporidium cionae]|eukprot:KAF8822289.1 putative Ornithine decarboxylase [Cardiosporidium cionae]
MIQSPLTMACDSSSLVAQCVSPVGSSENFPFEGVEKRIIMCFSKEALSRTARKSLRGISDEEWSALLDHTGCQIISKIEGIPHEPLSGLEGMPAFGDICCSYLLSESSLFVYECAFILKTCGITTPLLIIPQLLALLGNLLPKEFVHFVLFTHFEYQFPKRQIYPHRSFEEEQTYLNQFFPSNEQCVSCPSSGRGYFVFASKPLQSNPTEIFHRKAHFLSSYNRPGNSVIEFVEVFMKGVDEDSSALFSGPNDTNLTKHPAHPVDSSSSGILGKYLSPETKLDQFWFSPCGYSCNMFNSDGDYMNVHISPEKEVSYVSFELMNYSIGENGDARISPLSSLLINCLPVFSAKEVHVITLKVNLGSLEVLSNVQVVPSDERMHHFYRKTGHYVDSSLYERMSMMRMEGGFYNVRHLQYSDLVDSDRCDKATVGVQICEQTLPEGKCRAMDKCSIQEVTIDSKTDRLTEFLSAVAFKPNLNNSQDNFKTKGNPNALALSQKMHLDVHLLSDCLLTYPFLDADTVKDLHRLFDDYGGVFSPAGSDGRKCPKKLLRDIISDGSIDHPVMLVDMSTVVEQWCRWQSLLPNVLPYYAVKCNNDPLLLDCLATLGVCFDCATKPEMEMILALKERRTNLRHSVHIVYSNPCKFTSEMEWANEKGIKLLVFDNIDEIQKISVHYPTAELLLRIRTDDRASQCPMSAKFGASISSWPRILSYCRKLNLNVRGISFHVGSGCGRLGAFSSAIESARSAFDLAKNFDYHFNLLDIGGGFPGDGEDANNHPTFEELACEIQASLHICFGSLLSEITCISEPGRYFAHSSHTLATKIFARRAPYDYFDASYPTDKVLSIQKNFQESSLGDMGLECSSTTTTAISDEVFSKGCDNCSNSLDIEVVAEEGSCKQHSPMDDTFSSDGISADMKKNQDEMYWLYVNESLYGVFNCLLYDHATVVPEILSPSREELVPLGNSYYVSSIKDVDVIEKLQKCDMKLSKTILLEENLNAEMIRKESCNCVIFGQSCDGFDCLFKNVELPEMFVGDWLMFRNMGAYTTAASSSFNGFKKPKHVYAWLYGSSLL